MISECPPLFDNGSLRHTNLIFDVVVPFEYEPSDSQIIAKLQQKADLELNGTFFLKIQIDRAYVKYEVNA